MFAAGQLAVRDGLVVFPELVECIYRIPFILNEGLRFAEKQMKSSRENPLALLRTTIFGSITSLSGAIIAASDGPVWLWASLLAAGFLIAGTGYVLRR